jgi:hypothetical protein
MKSALFIKFPRVLLAFTVSVWMAGGCLLGCTNMQAMGAETLDENTTLVEGESCEPAAAHSCCTKPKSGKQQARQATTVKTQNAVPATGETLTTTPRGMADCPLMVNATAVTSKSSGNLPEPGHAAVAQLPRSETQIEQAQVAGTPSYRPNRGHTHLRCCVFRI